MLICDNKTISHKKISSEMYLGFSRLERMETNQIV